MAVIGKITLYEHWDIDKFMALLDDGETLYLDIDRAYPIGALPESLTAVLPVQFGSENMEALVKAIDAAAYVHEENCIVWIVKTDDTAGARFDLLSSYVRVDIDTNDPVPEGTELKAVFVTPGLPASLTTAVMLRYNTAFSSADIEALNAAGITLSAGATGSDFTIISKTPFTLRLVQPSAAPQNYVIDFNGQGQIFTP